MQHTPPNHGRRHDLDWLRLIAILILLFFHTGMLFNNWGWHIKNPETNKSFEWWMGWLHYWRMPLLLFISGAGTYMALGKRTPGQYAKERFTRLFIPLVFGMFVVVPPQIYYEHIKAYSSYWEFYKTVFNFVPYPKGSFSWHHLWFICYLFFYSLIALPYLVFLRSPASLKFRLAITRILQHPLGILMVPSSIILITQIILRPYFPDNTNDLIHDWAFFVLYFCFFLFGMTCYSSTAIWDSIGANRKKLLIAAVAVLIPFYVGYMQFYGFITLPLNDDLIEIIFDVNAIFLAWFTVIAVIAYGQHYLFRETSWLPRVNEGIYSFYILHQTIIIFLGYYICQLDWSIFAKFWVISLATLAISVVLIEWGIRPIAPLRLVFGLKIKKQR